MTPLLDVRGARQALPDARHSTSAVHAVDDVTFSIAPGECVGLVGESGCGKSTLVRLITRLLDPTDGRIRFDGRRHRRDSRGALRDLALSAPRIQMVFQDPTDSLEPALHRVRRHRRAAAAPRAAARPARACAARVAARWPTLRRAAARAARARTRTSSRADRSSASASRGRSRSSPRLLVLDEPTSALDVSVQAVILHLLADLRERLGMTYLFVSHDLNVVRLFSDRVLVMYLGQVVESGPAERVFERRATRTRGRCSRLSPCPIPPCTGSASALAGEPRSPIDPSPHVCRFSGRCPDGFERCEHENAAVTRRRETLTGGLPPPRPGRGRRTRPDPRADVSVPALSREAVDGLGRRPVSPDRAADLDPACRADVAGHFARLLAVAALVRSFPFPTTSRWPRYSSRERRGRGRPGHRRGGSRAAQAARARRRGCRAAAHRAPRSPGQLLHRGRGRPGARRGGSRGSARGGRTRPGPLAGVPFAVKNLFDVAGIAPWPARRSTARTRSPRATRRPSGRSRAAGAVLVGALNMDEYAYGFTTENTHYGPTRNPHDPRGWPAARRVGPARRWPRGWCPDPGDRHQRIDPGPRLPLRRLRSESHLWPGVAGGAVLFAGSFDHVGPLARSVGDLAVAFDRSRAPIRRTRCAASARRRRSSPPWDGAWRA